ncbi:MAG: rhomboid family intramembrane serine protease [Candidatus Longimicrobiales bacterium M2_2A_002]
MAYQQARYGGGSFSFTHGLTPWVKRIIIANVVVWLAMLAFSDLRPALAFVPAEILSRPWTLFTYMFVHGRGFFHIFFNMLILYFFGPPLESMWGGREFLKYYLVAGLSAAVFSFLAPNAGVIGASGAIYGIMLAFAMNWPDMEVYIWFLFPVKVKWLVGFLAAVSILSLVGGQQDGVAHWAHLGGFAGGFLYLKLQDQAGMQLGQLRKTVARRKFSVTAGGGEKGQGAEGPPRPGSKKEERVLDEVDRVLDKISESGLQSLTEEELKLLDRVSRKYRQN